MFQHSKIISLCLNLLWILCILSATEGSNECANITNLTRISAASVLVEWQYPISGLMFDIKVFDAYNGSLVHNQPQFLDYRNEINTNIIHAYLIRNLTSTTQHLCFTVQLENAGLLTTTTMSLSPSSGDNNDSDDPICAQECLPRFPQVPDAPQGFHAANSTTAPSSQVLFNWNATKGSVLLSCSRNDGVVPTIIRELCGSCSPVHVGTFEHSSQYTCTLSEKTGVMVGTSSAITFYTDVERLSPPEFAITSVDSTSITIQIEPLNSPVEYMLCILPQLNTRGCMRTTSNPGNPILLSNLYPASTYEVQVQVRNMQYSAGSFSHPSSKTVTTLANAPGKIMLVSVYLKPGTSTILVSWTPPEINNGSIIEYRYCWSLTDTSEKQCENTTGNSTTIDLSLLGTVYGVCVAAYTEGGIGPFSDQVYVHIPGAVVPQMNSSYEIGDKTASYFQLKMTGISNCPFWMMNNSQTLRNDIINDLSTQILNMCKCRSLLNSVITNDNIQCISDYELLFHAQLTNCSISCRERNSIERWFISPSSHITVSNQSLVLLLSRTCPLFTSSQYGLAPITTTTSEASSSGSSNSGPVAGALIGGMLLGAILAVAIGLGIFMVFWFMKRRRGQDGKNLKEIEAVSDTPLCTRYTAPDKNTNGQTTDGEYEPVSICAHDSVELENAYEPTGIGLVLQYQSAAKKPSKGKSANQKKQRASQDKSATKQPPEQKVFEDEAGYVVPDVLWEGKQRPKPPGSNQPVQTPASSKANIAATTVAEKTTDKVEYDVPEGVEKAKSHHSWQVPSIHSKDQPEKSAIKAHKKTSPSTGKGRQKQAKAVVGAQQQEHTLQQLQPAAKQSKKSVQSNKPEKKKKPYLNPQNSSQLARQYLGTDATTTSDAQTASTSKTRSHDAVKSKLNTFLSPAASVQAATTHKPLTRQTSSSTIEKIKEESVSSKVKAMATMLEGGGGQGGSSNADSEAQDTKSKKKSPLLPKTAGNTLTLQTQQQQPPTSGAADTSKLLPTKKPKPAGKNTAGIAMKTNKAYDQWITEKDASASVAAQNPRGGGHRNENLYHY